MVVIDLHGGLLPGVDSGEQQRESNADRMFIMKESTALGGLFVREKVKREHLVVFMVL